MSAKTESKEAAPAAAPAETAAPASGGIKAWLPAILAIVLSPVASWAVAEFVLLPRLQHKLAAPAGAGHEEEAEPSGGGRGEGEHGKEGGSESGYEFTNVVVNLSGTMGTRYLKTSFLITGEKPALVKSSFEANKPKLTDVTLSVLSSLSLADLEEPGSKNVLREKLVAAYNQALGKRVAEQVYFSDFVIQ